MLKKANLLLRSGSKRFIYYLINKQVRLRLPDEDSEKGLKLVPGSHGMNVPSACTIVIIAGFNMTPI